MIILTNCERSVLYTLGVMHAELGEPPTILALSKRLGHRTYTTCQKVLAAARGARLVQKLRVLRSTTGKHGRYVLTPKGIEALEYRPPLLAADLGPLPAESTRTGGWPARRAREAHKARNGHGVAVHGNLFRTRGAYG